MSEREQACSLLRVLLHHAPRLDILAQRLILDIGVPEGPRPANLQPLGRLRPSWRASDAQHGDHDAVPELRHAEGPTGLRVQDGDQVRHGRDVRLGPVVGDVLRVDVLVLERDLEHATGRDRRGGLRHVGIFLLAALDLLDGDLAVRVALEEPPLDGDDLAAEEDFRGLGPAALVDHLLGDGADGVGGLGAGDAAADAPRERDGVKHAVVDDGVLVGWFGGHADAGAHLRAGGAQRAVDDLVVCRLGHEDGFAVAGGDGAGHKGASLVGAERRLPVRWVCAA